VTLLNLRRLKLRVRARFGPRRAERDLDDELAFHVEREAQIGVALFVLTVLPILDVYAQQPAGTHAFIAFRVDAGHVIASVKEIDDPNVRQIRTGLSPEPVARFGYRHVEVPPSFQEAIPSEVRAASRWLVHAGPGQTFDAVAERVVGGNPGCALTVGMLLKIAAPQSAAFARLSTRYFVAEVAASQSASSPAGSSLSLHRATSIDADVGDGIRQKLGSLLIEELPRVRAEAAPMVSRMAASPVAAQRAWALARQEIERALAAGRGRLTYDTQSVRLSPDGAAIYFVRAIWYVGQRKGFAGSFWLRRTAGGLDVIRRDVRPAAWLRMPEFRGEVARPQLGLVLNVVDRDGDGWGEVIVAQAGYESMAIALFELSRDGLEAAAIRYDYGC
jgi:hypothetical protein